MEYINKPAQNSGGIKGGGGIWERQFHSLLILYGLVLHGLRLAHRHEPHRSLWGHQLQRDTSVDFREAYCTVVWGGLMGLASLSLSWKRGPKMAGLAVLTLASQERWYLPAWIVGTDVGVLQDFHLS